MKPINIGILREGRIPTDRRVPLLPQQCRQIVEKYPSVNFFIQPSPERCIKDDEYKNLGLTVQEDMSNCDILFGVKEVPIPLLIPDKTYFFFSHTIKKQPHNRKLLQTILEKRITLIDYECLTDVNGNRIIAFGRYAGIVGTYNAFYTLGKRYRIYDLKRAFQCFDFSEVKEELKKVRLPAHLKIVLTGGGRVSNGAIEILSLLGIRKVSPTEFLEKKFDEPVFAQLRSVDYHRHKEGLDFESKEFHTNPEKYYSTFYKFEKAADMLIAGAYWDPKAPALFTKEDMQRDEFKIKIVADITCDIDGSIPCTKRASSINDPVYDYNPFTGELELPFSRPSNITVMAIDNLPGELARDASGDFGKQLMENVLPHLLGDDKDQIVQRATIAKNGCLTPGFLYLKDYVKV
ncbi:MAG: NAD(P)-dependent oxidoreductase [Cytophagaceae bacterium]